MRRTEGLPPANEILAAGSDSDRSLAPWDVGPRPPGLRTSPHISVRRRQGQPPTPGRLCRNLAVLLVAARRRAVLMWSQFEQGAGQWRQ